MSRFQPLRDFLDYYLPMLGIPGSDTVIYREHEEIFRHTAGYDNNLLKTPVRKDAIYNIYSCTKVLTGVAAARLVESGEILPSDPVYAYIPEFKDIRVKVRDGQGNVIGTRAPARPMLIRHLLTMTSGLSYDLWMPSIKRVIEETDGRAPTLDICRAIAEEPLEFDPGDKYNYSLSLDVIGGIIELVTGERLGDYMKRSIFDPLGMKDTAYHIDYSKSDRFATQYEYNAERGATIIPFENNAYRFGTEYDSAGAGLVSTVDDYILLMDALANGGVGKSGERILTRRGIDLMRTNHLTPAQLEAYGSNNYCDGYGYGYGVRMFLGDRASGVLATKGEFGWDGAKLCLAMADPEYKLSVFHAEHMGGLHSVVIPRIRNVIYSCLNFEK